MSKIKNIFKNRWTRKEVILLVEQLGLYISSGLELDRTLRLAEEHARPQRKLSLARTRLAVESGYSFAQAFSENISQDATVVEVILQGERSGELGRALQSVHVLLEKRDELIKKCVSAFVYPLVIGLFSVLLTVGLMRGVMPQIIPLLLSLNVELPLLTRTVIALSQGISFYGIHALTSLVILFFVARIVYRRSVHLRSACHHLLMRTPVVGGMIRSYSHSLFLRSCGSLIDAGLPAAESYEGACGTVPLMPLRDQFRSHIAALRNGTPMGNVLRSKALALPACVPALVSVGEASGTLGVSCIRTADIIDRALDHSLKRATGLMEPVLMIFMGCTVGAIALSIMLPIYDISKVLQR